MVSGFATQAEAIEKARSLVAGYQEAEDAKVQLGGFLQELEMDEVALPWLEKQLGLAAQEDLRKEPRS